MGGIFVSSEHPIWITNDAFARSVTTVLIYRVGNNRRMSAAYLLRSGHSAYSPENNQPVINRQSGPIRTHPRGHYSNLSNPHRELCVPAHPSAKSSWAGIAGLVILDLQETVQMCAHRWMPITNNDLLTPCRVIILPYQTPTAAISAFPHIPQRRVRGPALLVSSFWT